MDTQMKIDADLIKALRERRSWSQEHLADAAGVSLRTVQRVEADGAASSETRLALASALGVPAAKLSPASSVSRPISSGYRRGLFWGWVGWSVGALCSAAGVIAAVVASGASARDAGIAFGVLAAGLGVTAGLMGMLGERVRRREQLEFKGE